MTGRQQVPAEKIRNVVLLGHGGTGKTALAEALLTAAGVGSGRGGTFDFEPEERDRGHSLSLATASFEWQGHTINLLDAPGGPDAMGDAFPALPAADLAVFVVDASLGVQAQHVELWEACERLGLPRLLFLNKFDRENAAYQRNVDALQERYGKSMAPVHMPCGVEQQFNGVIDLLHSTAVTLVDGKRSEGGVPEDLEEQAASNRELLVEAIVENDDELLLRYLEGEVPEAKELGAVFARGIATCGFFPVLCGSVALDIGPRLLADFLVEECPSPADREPVVGAGAEENGTEERTLDGPVAVYVAKTLTDPYVGRINLLRVLSGRLEADDQLTVARSGASVRLHQLFRLTGKDQTPVDGGGAGELLAVAKLDDVQTGDTLHSKDAPFAVPPVPLPQPYHRVAIEPQSAGDEDKLSIAIARLVEEDPALQVDRDAETHQFVLHCMGPTHVDVTLARMERKFGVALRTVPRRLAYRETLRGPAAGLGRHVKQSGGHGQYGICQIEVEPLGRGAGFEFEDKIVGGVVPHTFISSVEKGVRGAMEQGVLAGYPVVDARVRLVDGKHHSVDSSQLAFELAGGLAFRQAAETAGMVLLEPIIDLEITAPDELTGELMGDISARRGRIQGTASDGGRTTVRAMVPEGELLSVVGEMRSLTSGTGSLRMRYDHHEELPDNLARKIVAAEVAAKQD